MEKYYEVEAVKKALRISTALFDDEISALVDAAKADMTGAGINVDNKDISALVLQAIKFYCRAYFSTNVDDSWAKHYEKLRDAIAARGVRTADYTETDNDR